MKFGRNVLQVDCKYAPIYGVGHSIWCHTFKPVAMTSFHAEKCCYLVSEHEAFAQRLCGRVRQFLTFLTRFVFLYSTVFFYILCIPARFATSY